MTIDQAMVIALDHYNAGRLPDAERLYRAVLSAQPGHPFAAHHLAMIAMNVGRADVAVDLLGMAVAGRPGEGGFHNSLGEALRLLGRYDEALAAYDRAAEFSPKEPIAHNNRGVALEALGRSAEAEQAYRVALALKPDYADALANLGTSLSSLGRQDEALASFRAAVEAAPANVEARLALGRALIGAGRLDEAVQVADALRAFQDQPRFPVLRHAMVYIDSGAREAAAQVLRDALIRDPADAGGARVMLAAIAPDQAAPERASDAQMGLLYAIKAASWDKAPGYRGAQLVADALKPGLNPNSEILDAGCGTGLVGARLAGHGRITGVDLSGEMIALAQAKSVYAELVQGDLLTFLQARTQAFDAIACAATLIHFGDLEPAFTAAAGALKPGGAFALTLFPLESDPDGFAVNPNLALAQNGVFAHGRRYIAAAAERCGLQVQAVRDEEHERNEGQATGGLLVLLTKAA
jgi:predicted TPR repeat methyltransferase